MEFNETNNKQFSFELLEKKGKKRLGIIHTAHGDIHTPIFMPVGTQATVKTLTNDLINSTGAEIILGNTYHLMLRPTADKVAQLGGLHKFMNWQKPILTDSGGFQVMSLAKMCKVREEGVKFRSHIDGTEHLLTPELSMEIQHKLDATITMAFDECTPYGCSQKRIKNAMFRSIRWAERCKKAFVKRNGYGQFGIVQGGDSPEMREICAKELIAMDFDGYAIGGMVGYNEELFKILDYALDMLPENKPRYVMGIGKPADLIGAIQRGADMFDCVLPSRYGRHGVAFVRENNQEIELKMRLKIFELDERPLEENCGCYACINHTRAYIHHLIRADEILGRTLLTLHNIQHLINVCKRTWEED